MRRVRAGQYVVDPHAVAGAMLRRPGVREALLGSEVLEPTERDRRPTRSDEPEPGSRPRT
ncbi:MAG: hypothetical protein M3340_02870 [Actinomycetota bacterium]|nr:hypothetical protein [Actinomycetota bacterium]